MYFFISIIKNIQKSHNAKCNYRQVLGVCNYDRCFTITHNGYVNLSHDWKILEKYKDWHSAKNHSNDFQVLKDKFARTACLKHIIPGAERKVLSDGKTLG